METVDEEFLGAAMAFIDKNSRANKPFLCWFNSTRMHIYTHLKASSQGNSTTSGLPTIPSSSTRPTTAPKSSHGPMVVPRRSTAKRMRVGRAVTAFLA